MRHVGFALATVILMLAGGFFWYFYGSGPAPAGQLDPAPAPSVTAAASTEKSIAVLPFADMSAEKNQEYMSDGIAEQVLNLLAQVHELKVIARTSSFAFKGQNFDIAEIAKKLKVGHVLEGSVRTSGNRLRITAQLIRASDSTHLWSQIYDRQMTDVFAVQDEIAAAVVSELKIKLLETAPKAKTTEPKAYALFLQAAEEFQYDSRSIEQAISLYRQVLTLDSSYAPAWDGLAEAYYNLIDYGVTTAPQTLPLARDAIDRALKLDPGYVPAYARAALIEGIIVGHLGAAAGYLEQGLARDPRNLEVIGAAVKITRRLGKLDQSLALAEYAAGRDPISVSSHENLGWAYFLTGRLDEAAVAFRTGLSLKPDAEILHSSLGEMLLHHGDPQAALVEMKLEPFELNRLFGLTMAYHALGQKTKSDAALKELMKKGEKIMPYYIAETLAFRGESNRAFEWIEKAIKYRDPYISWAAIDPKLVVLHTDPRWVPLLRRLGQAPEQLAAIKLDISVPN